MVKEITSKVPKGLKGLSWFLSHDCRNSWKADSMSRENFCLLNKTIPLCVFLIPNFN